MYSINLLLSSFHHQWLLMISRLTLRAAKLSDLFCPGSITSSLILGLLLLFFLLCQYFFSSLFFHYRCFDHFLRFFGFLVISSKLVSFFLFRFGALIFSFFVAFVGFISVLISTFSFFFLFFFFFGSVSQRTICHFFSAIFSLFFLFFA